MHIRLEEIGTGLIILNSLDHEETDCKLHTHSFAEIACVEEGRGVHSIGGDLYTITKGDIYLVNTLTPHTLEPYRGSRLQIINCLVDHHFLRQIIAEIIAGATEPLTERSTALFSAKRYDPSWNRRLLTRNTLHLVPLFRMMLQEYHRSAPLSPGRLKHYLIILLSEIDSLIGPAPDWTGESKLTGDIRDVLNQRYREPLGPKELSKILGYSDKYIARTFKRETGSTVVEYLQKLRIERAMDLLLSGDRIVESICREVGYHDISFFYHLFKKQTGFLPGEFRKATRQKEKEKTAPPVIPDRAINNF